MDNVQQIQGDNPTPDSEELKQEEEALKEAKQEEIRSQIIEKFGLDEETQNDLIDKLVGDQLEQRKALGKVIGQKRKYRELAQKPNEPKAPESKPNSPSQASQPDIDALVNERFEQRDLEALDYPEELKPEIKKLAKLQGISVRKAAQDPYILHRKQEFEQQKKVEEAAISRSNKGTQVKFDPNTPPEVDMSTEEGRKTWNEWKKFKASQSK